VFSIQVDEVVQLCDAACSKQIAQGKTVVKSA
jgi:hypothetical protein